MKNILMITTGGTIASKKTENGLAPGLSPEELLEYIPAVRDICYVDTLSVCNIDSTNVTPEHWKLMEQTIEDNYSSYDGFVICHGTDTLAYTAAALSYMIQNSPKPIVITGSQKPINVDVTDAKTNLLDSFLYAVDEYSHSVSIVFDGKVIAGTRARKSRAKSFNAFSSLNYPYTAVIRDGVLVRYIFDKPTSAESKVRFYREMRDSVCTLKLIPGVRPAVLSYLFEHYDCVVIESFGVGGIPDSLVDTFYDEMKKWSKKGKYVVMTTQVASEGSDMNVYEVGQRVKREFDLLESYDMTFEATITKLMWLMGQCLDVAEFKEKFYTRINNDILFSDRKSNG